MAGQNNDFFIVGVGTRQDIHSKGRAGILSLAVKVVPFNHTSANTAFAN